MILVSEAAMDLNAGYVLSIADQDKTGPDLTSTAQDLAEKLRHSRTRLLETTAPRTDPAILLKTGLVNTPLLDALCCSSLDLVHLWALIGSSCADFAGLYLHIGAQDSHGRGSLVTNFLKLVLPVGSPLIVNGRASPLNKGHYLFFRSYELNAR